MESLTLNAGTGSPVDVPCQRGTVQVQLIGEKSRAYAGNERSSVRGQKRVVSAVSAPVAGDVADAIEDALALGAQIPCTGEVFRGATVTCSGDVSSEAIPGTSPVLWQVSITLSEV